IYTPDDATVTADTFIYIACDTSLCDTALVVITYNAADSVNDAPNAVDDNFSADAGEIVNGDVSLNDSDPEGDELTFTVLDDVNNGTLVFNNDGTFIYTPDDSTVTADTFIYIACDTSLCDTAVVIITFNGISIDSTIVLDDDFTTPEDTPLNGTVAANDFDPLGAMNTYEIILPPVNGFINMQSDGQFVYTPDLDFNGLDTMRYQVIDNAGDTFTAHLTILVTPVNDPRAVDDYYTTPVNTLLSANVSLNDVDLGGFVYLTVSSTSHGELMMDGNGVFSYMPDTDFDGEDQFEYEACDSDSDTNCYSATVIIDVISAGVSDGDISIIPGFSPDGDGVNDNFTILNVDQYPNCKVTIFNRWGNILYETDSYDSQQPWNGTISNGMGSGSKVSPGTYFYVIETGASTVNASRSGKTLSGFVVIKHNER
ncbi:MAG: Ig-like domain-containing protein, partial [Flavobacteriales bacterium]